MRLFDPEGPLMTALSKLADIVICNIMFVLFSLPILTFGASRILQNVYERKVSPMNNPGAYPTNDGSHATTRMRTGTTALSSVLSGTHFATTGNRQLFFG